MLLAEDNEGDVFLVREARQEHGLEHEIGVLDLAPDLRQTVQTDGFLSLGKVVKKLIGTM